MTDPVTVPFWFLAVVILLALWVALDRLLMPGVRWFFRRRVNIVIDEINNILSLRLPAFSLTKRQVLIDRLMYDPQVLKVVEEYCREQKMPRKVVMEKVERYAREIVPSFNAYTYFRVGSALAKSIARFLYRVRLGYVDEEGLRNIKPDSSIVFIMNHRSNMDYIMVGYLAVNRVALSFAVGEWARIWPIQQLVRSLGAYFVRRGSHNPLYRAVLANYVRMATEGGVVQAVFPEGCLTRDGYLREPKLGLLDYMLRSFNPQGERDLVFIPVAVNYDRVLEDRSLLRKLDPRAGKRSKLYVIIKTLGFIFHNLLLMLKGGWYRFGYAVANVGTPVSMREYCREAGIAMYQAPKETRIKCVQDVAGLLMKRIGAIVPVVPVALISAVFMENSGHPLSGMELKVKLYKLVESLEEKDIRIYLPRRNMEYTINVGLRMLTLRHIVEEQEGLYRVAPDQVDILRYYANSIQHLL